jgi:hypothetical protein
MRKFTLAVPLLMLTACVSPTTDAQSIQSVEVIKLSSSATKSLESAVRDGLKDPSSAQFGRYIAFNATDANGATITGACGYVNAKNSYGGYGGMTPYIATGLRGEFVSATIGEFSMKVCQKLYGVSI